MLSSTLYYLHKPRLLNRAPVNYAFTSGATTVRLAYDLYDHHIITHPRLFTIIVLLEGRAGHLQSGGYQFKPGISLQQIIDKLTYGDIEKHQITIIDGWTFKQALQIMAENPYLQHKLTGLSSEQISKKLHLKHKNPEGLFLPETYQFTWPDSDVSILKRAHKAFEIILNAEWKQRTTGLQYKKPYQALIVASMIEKESADRTELNKISGVIYRRLQKNMRLQIDPTVIYAMGDSYQGKITRKGLWLKSPYNTYRRRGLPPTPIALPSAGAIHAALQPDSGSELYFVANGTGGHQFSSTLKAHDRAVLKYILDKKGK